MQSVKLLKILAASTIVAISAGCGSSGTEDQVPVFPVSGKIIMNGSPVPDVMVTFSPKEDQPIAWGLTDSDGVYHLTTYGANDGAAQGAYIVLVTKNSGSDKSVSNQDAIHSAMSAGGGGAPQHSSRGTASAADSGAENLLNDKYARNATSDLKATVSDTDPNNYDFTLEE